MKMKTQKVNEEARRHREMMESLEMHFDQLDEDYGVEITDVEKKIETEEKEYKMKATNVGTALAAAQPRNVAEAFADNATQVLEDNLLPDQETLDKIIQEPQQHLQPHQQLNKEQSDVMALVCGTMLEGLKGDMQKVMKKEMLKNYHKKKKDDSSDEDDSDEEDKRKEK